MKKNYYIKLFVLRSIGNFMILTSLFVILKTFYPPLQSEIRFFVDNKILKRTYVLVSEEEADSARVEAEPVLGRSRIAELFRIPQVEALAPVDPSFSIVIPKIAANARISPNVNPSNEAEYLEKLKTSVAHAAGTYFPGENGNIYLFAHSTDYLWNVSVYNAVFYLLYKLEPGDEVNVFFQGRRYIYVVDDKKIVGPADVLYLTQPSDHEILTLQTCWPPGTTLQRLLVFARPKRR
jgi:sortase A